MKLLYVSPSYWPAVQFGGPPRLAHNLCRRLAAMGHEVVVYATNVGVEDQVPADRETLVDGVRVTYFSYTTALDWLSATGWQYSPVMTRGLRRHVRDFDVVVVAAVWNYPALAASRLARRHGVPFALMPLGVLDAVALAHRWWKKRPYFALFGARMLRRATAVFCLTRAEERAVSALADGRCRTLRFTQGIDLDEFRTLPDRAACARRFPELAGKRLILFFGRLSWKKGLDLLAAAAEAIIRERDDVHVVVAGPDEAGYRRQAEGLFDRSGLRSHVTFTGALDGADRLAVLAGADVFALPSYSEGFSMAVVEALAAGLPVVVSHACNFPEVEEAGAGIVIAPEAGALEQALRRLLSDEATRAAMAARARALAFERYDLEGTAREFSALLAAVAAGRAAA